MRYITRAVKKKTIRSPVKTPPTQIFPSGNDHVKLMYALFKDGVEVHEGGGDVEDRARIYRQYPMTHANDKDALTNSRSMRYTRSYSLGRTASLSLQSFKAIMTPRGHSEIIHAADPRACGYAYSPPRRVPSTYIL